MRHNLMAAASPVGRAVAKANAAKTLAEFDAYVRKINLLVYLTDDGAPCADLLARLALALGVGAELGIQLEPNNPDSRRMHAALRAVVQMSVNGGKWQASQAKVLHEAAELAKTAFITYPHASAGLLKSAGDLSRRIRAGTARMSDVAGAEVYNKTKELTA